MSNHRRKTVEWVLRAVETVAVFSAMSWALFWAVTHRRSDGAGSRTRAQIGDAPPVGPGHQVSSVDSVDPDGAGSLERSRRRRHVD